MIPRTRHVIAALLLAGSTASAQTDVPLSAPRELPAAASALELVIGFSTTHTVGDVGDGRDADDLIGDAGQLDLEIGYRITPALMIGFYSNAQALAEGSRDGRSVHTGAAGIEAAVHLDPRNPLDPWLSVGTGVRAYLIGEDGDTTIGVGADLLRLQLGADFRIDESLAIGPVVGATAALYGAEKQPMEDFHELSGKGINWTFTAGVAGRVDLFGTRR